MRQSVVAATPLPQIIKAAARRQRPDNTGYGCANPFETVPPPPITTPSLSDETGRRLCNILRGATPSS